MHLNPKGKPHALPPEADQVGNSPVYAIAFKEWPNLGFSFSWWKGWPVGARSRHIFSPTGSDKRAREFQDTTGNNLEHNPAGSSGLSIRMQLAIRQNHCDRIGWIHLDWEVE
jgi:hypothetical protein